MNDYMILIRGSWTAWKALPPEEVTAIRERYNAWAQKLAQEKRMRGGSESTEHSRRIRSVNGSLVADGPFPESKEALTGFFHIAAASLEEATEIARGCPALTHGAFVEIVEVPSIGPSVR